MHLRLLPRLLCKVDWSVARVQASTCTVALESNVSHLLLAPTLQMSALLYTKTTIRQKTTNVSQSLDMARPVAVHD